MFDASDVSAKNTTRYYSIFLQLFKSVPRYRFEKKAKKPPSPAPAGGSGQRGVASKVRETSGAGKNENFRAA